MKKITAKFNSTCAETGAKIRKGDSMYYNYTTKKCYCIASDEAQYWEGKSDQKYRSIHAVGAGHYNDFVQDPGEVYFDNFCQSNNI